MTLLPIRTLAPRRKTRAAAFAAIAALLVTGTPGCGPPAPPMDHGPVVLPWTQRAAERDRREARIRRVERGLTSSTAVEGTPAERWTIEERMEFYAVPGVSIAVIEDGALDWARAYGAREAGGELPVDTLTLFQAGAISELVTAIGALTMAEEGGLALDDDVNRWLRSWQVPASEHTSADRVTLRRLLGHRAGLEASTATGFPADATAPHVVELLRGVGPQGARAARVAAVPGSRREPSAHGYSIVQLLMSDATGVAFPDVMVERVFRPAGLPRSTFDQPITRFRSARAATGHTPGGDPIPGRWQTYPEQAAAGLWTTPTELARLVLEVQRALRGEPALITSSAASIPLALVEDGGRTLFRHDGANRGFRALLVGFRDSGQGAVIMANGEGGAPLAMEILRGIAREYHWGAFAPRERILVP